jgi:hypothetical protein
MSLAEAVNAARVRRPLADVPKALKHPGVTYKDGVPSEIVTPDVGVASTQADYHDLVTKTCEVPIPLGYELQLVQAWHNTNAWSRDKADAAATTKAVWRYHFKVVRTVQAERMVITELAQFIKTRRSRPRTAPDTSGGELGEIVNLADLQIGKVDERGGTAQLEDRFYGGMEEVLTRVKKSKPTEIVLAELGDGCENFQNQPDQAFSNDRSLIAQLDLHATFLTYAATELAKLAPKLTVVGVPSNHMDIRVGGKAVGGPENDYGLLTLSQLQRAFSLNPRSFGHVEFAWPDPHAVSVVRNVAGTNVMFTHGHYTRGAGAADGVPKWLEHQFAANAEYHSARVVFTGHYHHLRIQQIIGGRWWLQAPALDNGSSWLKRVNGQGDSDAGILVVQMTKDGWSRQEILGSAA